MTPSGAGAEDGAGELTMVEAGAAEVDGRTLVTIEEAIYSNKSGVENKGSSS